MHVLVYFCVAVSIFLLMFALDLAGRALERHYRIKQIREANAHLLQKQRAADKELRRLRSKLSAQDYQRSSALEHKLQLAQDEISRLRRELKVKESLLRAIDRQNGAGAAQDGEKAQA